VDLEVGRERIEQIASVRLDCGSTLRRDTNIVAAFDHRVGRHVADHGVLELRRKACPRPFYALGRTPA
jgi:hypothetical protein